MTPTIAVATLPKKIRVSIKVEDFRFVNPSEIPRINPRRKDMAPPSRNTSPHCHAETSEDSSRANARASAEANAKTPPSSAMMVPMVSISLANVKVMATPLAGASVDRGVKVVVMGKHEEQRG